MWSDFDVLGECQNIPIFLHVLDVFSGQGDRIEPVPIALSHASWDTSLDYPQHIIPRNSTFGWLTPTWGTPRNIFFSCPPKRVIVWKLLQFSVSKMPLVSGLKLCLKKPDSMQKKSTQSDHPTRRKRPNCGPNLLFWAIVKISQYFSTFWSFSLGRVIRFGWFLLQWVRLLEPQV